ncbi:MAG: hypothetical protein AAB316_15335, partial [Bacteroidota bacterium]
IQVFGQGWEKYYGTGADDYFQAVIQTRDHGFVAAGYSQGGVPGTNSQMFAIRTDVDGSRIWEGYYGQGWSQQANSIIETADKGFLLLGTMRNTQPSKSDVFLVKIDKKGKFQWSKQYGGINGHDGGHRIIRTENAGGYLLVGFTESFGNGGNDIFLVKIDEQGNQQWSKTFGGAGDDAGKAALEISDGYLVTGSVENPATASSDIYLLKVDFDGNEQWHKFFGFDGLDEGNDLELLNDGNVALAGILEFDAFLLKATLAGDTIWTKTLGNSLEDKGYDLLEKNNGDLVLIGSTDVNGSANVLLASTDANGNLLWLTNHGRELFIDEGHVTTPTIDGGFITAGYTSNLLSGVGNDAVLTKTG